MIIELFDLEKISLNVWYSSSHWSKRKKIKDKYKLMVKSQFKRVFSKEKTYDVCYTFNFIKRPLDASNCVAMLKMIEDIIFQDDSYKIIKKLTIKSRKSTKNSVIIEIIENN